jgi:hypothetical protein
MPQTDEEKASESARVATDMQRFDQGRAIVERQHDDIAHLTDDQFEDGLRRIKVRFERMERILATALQIDKHYGVPVGRDGRPAFKKPFLYMSGAEELRNCFGLKCRDFKPAEIIQTKEWTSVTTFTILEDRAGRMVAPRGGNCNTLEGRFRAQGGGWTYADAREKLHDCIAMSEKRSAKLSTSEATGATGFFVSEAELAKGIAAGLELQGLDTDDKPEDLLKPWTQEQREMVLLAAETAGIKTRGDLRKMLTLVCGRDENPITPLRAEVPKIMAHLTQLGPNGAVPPPAIKSSPEPYGEGV